SAAVAAGMLFSTAAVANDVSLKSADGTVNINGEFIALEEGVYIIRTALGDMRVSAARVRCEGPGCPSLETTTADVTIAGSATIGLGMMPLLMTGFATSVDADVEVNNVSEGQSIATLFADGGFGDEIGSYLVSTTSDDGAFSALLDGTAQVGMSSRRITRDEARALRADGAGNMVSPQQESILAIDNVVVVTHPSNPVKQLTKEQLRAIFSGEIRNWSQVGGNDFPINVVARDAGSSSHAYFMNYLFEGENSPFLAQAIANDDQGVSNTVFFDRYSIGYVGYAFQRGTKAMTLVNECGITVSPDAFSAKTEEYDLSRRLYLYSRSDNFDKPTKDLVEFAKSELADGVIAKSGFIDLGIIRSTPESIENRKAALQGQLAGYDVGFEEKLVEAMLKDLGNNDRLSTTFRFNTGSSKLDERGRLDVSRLISYLERAEKDTKITFVGFTDDVGAFEGNRQLSQNRADTLMFEIRSAAQGRLDHIQMEAKGYGELSPSACNVTDQGRSINRRVEVWISNGNQES
ncbi:MAG: phosphate ABC transporter substrate-binding/OmpA family protein, partial [Pseudomonadota bacterium]